MPHLVKRAHLAIAGAAVLAVLGLAVPAVSLGPHRPEPVEFELPVAGGGAPSPSPGAAKEASGGAFVSPPLRAPKRFNLVGLRWRGEAEPRIALRVRGPGGGWSRWTPVPAHPDDAPDPGRGERDTRGASAPVWTGQSEWIQLRASERPPRLRLHFVNTTGTATAGDRALTAARRVAGRALASASVVVGRALGTVAPGARAAARPPIVSREEWGAGACPPRSGPSYGQVKAAFIHHTVNANTYSREEAPAVVLAICRYHRNSNGWNDIGYNFLVDRFGTIYEGRAGGTERAVIGAQAAAWNAQSTGIANIGNHVSTPQSRQAIAAMVRLIRWKLPLHGAPTSGQTTLVSAGGSSSRYPAGARVRFDRISGHRDGNSTACPGDALYAQLPDIRRRARGAGPAQPERTATVIDATVAPALVRYGARARVSGRLSLVSGVPVGRAPVVVERLTAGGWRATARTRTDADGLFGTELAPPARWLVRASFAGDEERLPSSSAETAVAVRPVVALTAPSRAAVRQRILLRGTIAPPKARVGIVVQRVERGRSRTVLRLRGSARRGRFTVAYRFRRAALYRLLAVFGGDGAHAPASSSGVSLRVGAGRGSAPPSGGEPAGR